LQAEQAGAVDARRQGQRQLRPRYFIDCPLQGLCLIAGCPGGCRIAWRARVPRVGCAARASSGDYRQRTGNTGC
jgi:hypothetical protein